MKRIIRRAAALMFCALLVLVAPLAAAQDVSALSAQVVVTLPDGSQQSVPATTVVTTLGDSVFWVDQNSAPDLSGMLGAGQLVLTDDWGNQVAVIPLEGSGADSGYPVQFVNQSSGMVCWLLITGMPAPMSPAEADEALAPYGFATPEPEPEPTPDPTEEPTPEPTPEPTEDPTPEPTEEPTPEPTEEPTPEPTEEPTPEPTEEPTPEPTEEPIPDPTEEPAPAPTEAPAVEPAPEIPSEPELPEDTDPAEEQPGEPGMTFPAWAITIEQSNDAVIVLRGAPGGEPPQTGSISMIRVPTPLELSEAAPDMSGQMWYLARNMNNGDTGYIEAYNVRLVTQQEAEAAIVAPDPTLAPPPPENTPEPTKEPEATQAPTPIPEEPQTMTAGPVYHYGFNTGSQVNVRKQPTQSSGSLGKLERGTIIWVMERTEGSDKDAWCLVRVGNLEGYMKAEFIQLMGVNEEQAYIATLDDPEVAPERTPDPTEAPTAEPTEEPTQAPQPTAEPTAEPTQAPQPTAEPTEEPTAEPQATAEPTAEPTQTPLASPTPEPQDLHAYARVLRDGTPLRGNPDGDAKLEKIMFAEEVVYVLQSQLATDGMTWYLAQHNGQWGYVRADLVRLMGEQETAEYLAALEAAQATPSPMPQNTPEPVGPNSTSAYAKLIKDSVNLRRTPSASGTSLGRVPINTLLLVFGEAYDGTYTWYQVDYNGQEGYIRSDMAQRLTIAELQAYLNEQAASSQKPNATAVPGYNSGSTGGNYTGSNQNLQDLIPVDDSWTNNVIDGMPAYATASPDPNATPTPKPPEIPATLLGSSGTIRVYNVPALTETGTFSVYGTVAPLASITATVTMTIENTPDPAASPAAIGLNPRLLRVALAEGVQTVTRTVGTAVADGSGAFTMDVKLPMPGEYVVSFTTSDNSYARYGVTYDDGALTPTVEPLPTVDPVEETNSGFGILPIIIGIVVLLLAAAIYGVYIYRRRQEEEEEDETDEEEESELREEQLRAQRLRRDSMPIPPTAPVRPTAPVAPVKPVEPTAPTAPAAPVAPVAPRFPSDPANPSAVRPAQTAEPVSPYARPANAPAPAAPAIPTTPIAPMEPTAPVKPVEPTTPVAPVTPVEPTAPVAPVTPAEPTAPAAPTASESGEAPVVHRRRRPPIDPNANA